MNNLPIESCPVNLSDEDILEAMKEIRGYIDITTGDFKEIYGLAFRHALKRLNQSIRAKDVMSKDFISVGKDMDLKDVADLMNRHDISGVPVVEKDNTVVGFISEKDFLFQLGDQRTRSFMGVIAHCLKSTGCIALSIKDRKAKDIMITPVTTVRKDAVMSEIALLLTEKNIRQLPVVDSSCVLKGIISRVDLVQSYCSFE
ncbi:MAG: CBS domain-containing protein [Deltaproteobacteria bacterium]|nr:CBS domain-containing protein [Deltaproteobacteria bacterium]